MKSLMFALSILALTATFASAQSAEVKITDFFSNIEGCDVTIQGQSEAKNLRINLELWFKGKITESNPTERIVDSKSIEIESIDAGKYYTYFITWNSSKEDGVYTARAELRSNSAILDGTHLNFTYGHAALLRLQVADLLADSTGVYLLVRPFEPVMADAEYHLFEGNRSIYSVQEKNLAFIQSTSLNQNWRIILENNKEYAARIKLRLYKPEQTTVAYTRWFTARDNAIITDVYADRTGVSATIEGKSQVPLQGKLEFTIMREGVTVETIQKPSPSILLDEEKTVEATWKQPLSAGKYEVKVRLLGNDGDILDQYDKVIEVEPVISKPTPTPAKKSPAIELPLVLFAILAGYLAVRGRWGG